eukprot:gene30845-35885_t
MPPISTDPAEAACDSFMGEITTELKASAQVAEMGRNSFLAFSDLLNSGSGNNGACKYSPQAEIQSFKDQTAINFVADYDPRRQLVIVVAVGVSRSKNLYKSSMIALGEHLLHLPEGVQHAESQLPDPSGLANHYLRRCTYVPWTKNNQLAEADQNIKALRCGSCKDAIYCSKDCQAADWPSHKPKCKTMSALKDYGKKAAN